MATWRWQRHAFIRGCSPQASCGFLRQCPQRNRNRRASSSPYSRGSSIGQEIDRSRMVSTVPVKTLGLDGVFFFLGGVEHFDAGKTKRWSGLLAASVEERCKQWLYTFNNGPHIKSKCDHAKFNVQNHLLQNKVQQKNQTIANWQRIFKKTFLLHSKLAFSDIWKRHPLRLSNPDGSSRLGSHN